VLFLFALYFLKLGIGRKKEGEQLYEVTESIILSSLIVTYIGVSVLVYKQRDEDPELYRIYFYLSAVALFLCLITILVQNRLGFDERQISSLLLTIVAIFTFIYGVLKTRQRDR